MNLKTLSLTMLAAAAMVGAQAQSTDSDADKVAAKQARIAGYTTTIAQDLGLNDEQTRRMAQADEKYAIAMSAVRSMTTEQDLLIKKSEELYNEHEASLKEILGAGKYQELLEWRKAKSREGMKQLEPVAPPPTK